MPLVDPEARGNSISSMFVENEILGSWTVMEVKPISLLAKACVLSCAPIRWPNISSLLHDFSTHCSVLRCICLSGKKSSLKFNSDLKEIGVMNNQLGDSPEGFSLLKWHQYLEATQHSLVFRARTKAYPRRPWPNALARVPRMN